MPGLSAPSVNAQLSPGLKLDRGLARWRQFLRQQILLGEFAGRPRVVETKG
jgi:hypothetical protein